MKKFVIFVAVVILASIVYFNWNGNSDTSDKLKIEVPLVAQSNSGETGGALLVEDDGQVRVTINLTGFPEGVPQPAHIHRGTCASLGEPLYALGPVADGLSETVLTASMVALETNLPLAINVHRSADQLTEYVACGDIIFSEK